MASAVIQKLCYLAGGSTNLCIYLRCYMRSSMEMEPPYPSPIRHFHMSKYVKLSINDDVILKINAKLPLKR